MPSHALGELAVVYDSRQTRPLAPLLNVFGQTPPSPPTRVASQPLMGAADARSLLPIRSPGLSTARIAPRSVDRPFTRPFFLIGSDGFSRRWLVTHRDRLAQIGAVGMLVQAETVEDLEAIAEIARGLPILPASASDVAGTLGLSHYPVLVSRQGIEQ